MVLHLPIRHNIVQVAWLMGYPLSQTLFTSVHLERLLWPEPKRLSDASFHRGSSFLCPSPSLLQDVFRPYCIGLVKCCDLILSMIMGQHYYEVRFAEKRGELNQLLTTSRKKISQLRYSTGLYCMTSRPVTSWRSFKGHAFH